MSFVEFLMEPVTVQVWWLFATVILIAVMRQ
jgi:hypothetical protein